MNRAVQSDSRAGIAAFQFGGQDAGAPGGTAVNLQMVADGDVRLRELEAGLGLESGRVVSIGAYAVPATART